MASIFSLYGEIFVDNEKAKTSIDDIKKKGEETGTSFAEKFGSIATTALKVGTAVVGATTTVIGGLMAMANKTSSTADEFDKASLRTGLQVEELQRLNYAAGQSGVEMSSLEKSAKKLNDRLGEVSEGNKTTTAMFEKLGVSIQDSNGQIRSSTDIYNDVLTKLADMGDTAEATAIGTDLFGKSFTDMKPLLASGSKGIEDLKNRADELGIVLSKDTVSAGVVFGDTLSDIKQAFGGMFNSISGALIPVLQTFLDLIIENIPTISSMISTFAPVLTNLLSAILPPFMELAKTLLPVIIQLINQLLPFISTLIQAILPVIIQLLDLLLPPLLQIIELILPLLISLIEPLLPLLEPILQLLQPLIDLLLALIEPLIEILDLILPPLINLFTSIIDFILPSLQDGLSIVSSVLESVFGGALENIKETLGNLINVFKNIIDFVKNVFTGNWKGAWENVKNIFSNIASALGNIFKAPINFIIDIINGFIKGLNKIKIPDWVPGVGGKGINIPLIQKLRVGMEYVPYDEMPAILHKGETVLDKEEAEAYRRNKNKDNSETSNTIINNNFVIEYMEVRKESDIEDIAEELYYMQKKEVGA